MPGKRKLLLGFFALLLLVSVPFIIKNALWLVRTPAVLIQDRWDLVALNVLVFISFLAFAGYHKKVSWSARGIYSAFIVALFAEMYGFPLTTYFLSSAIGGAPLIAPEVIISFSVLGASFAMTWVMIAGLIVTIAGAVLVVLGWSGIYNAKGKLVTKGIYQYSRNPQYVGFFLITGGWLLAWPTIINLFMWPVLLLIYWRLALREEKDVGKKFGKEFLDYRQRVPMWA